MSSNVGLSTPRGSGTSGYVQRNMSYLRPRDQSSQMRDSEQLQKYRQRAPDAEILAHDRKREVEVKCLELQDKLEEEELDEEEITMRVEALRKKLLAEIDKATKIDARGLKPHQVHELAAAKMVESERLRNALGISKDYEEGSHWRRQEEEKMRKMEQREKNNGNSSSGRRRSASPPRRSER
ncbi:cwf21-domain-containing protein [Wilcoxina mikolae CBS 423.85]|nr:cwf21-domain-containing protein [Wilcoxina mikolae CBS 423.85]